ncbi:MAG: hypothetical protein KDD82_27520 [Planctomycetes bacterium]|nr:hypothetical protein [Planctomycetota bacterium]
MNLSHAATLWLLTCSVALAGEGLRIDVSDQPLELQVGELLERYATPNHLTLRVDAQIKELPIRFLEGCTLDRRALSGLLRTHGVSLVSAGDGLYAGPADRPNHWPAIPRVVAPGTELAVPTELVTTVLALGGDERLGQSLVQVRKADQHQDVALTWLPGRVVLTGPAERVAYYLRLAEELGTPSEAAAGVRLIQVQYAPVSEVAQHLESMLQGKGERADAPQATITAVPRSNQLLLRGSEPWLLMASKVVAELDVRVAAPVTPAPRKAIDVSLFALPLEAWDELSAGKRPAEVLSALLVAAGEERVQQLWHAERWVVSTRDSRLSEQQHTLGEGLVLSNLSLTARLEGDALEAGFSAQVAQDGQPLCTVALNGSLRLDAGVAVHVSSLDAGRVLILVASGR